MASLSSSREGKITTRVHVVMPLSPVAWMDPLSCEEKEKYREWLMELFKKVYNLIDSLRVGPSLL